MLACGAVKGWGVGMCEQKRGAGYQVQVGEGEVTWLPLTAGIAERPLVAGLARGGYVLNTRCGGKGLCRGCEVEVEGAVLKSCQVRGRLMAGKRVVIPERSLLGGSLDVAVDFQPRCGHRVGANTRLVGDRPYGLAVDIGTTTVVMVLVEGQTGRIIGRASGYNRQVEVGEDVLTRIDRAGSSAAAAEHLRTLLVEGTLGALWREIEAATAIGLAAVAEVVVAANTTLLHLLVGAPVAGLGRVPFRPEFLEMRRYTHGEIGWATAAAGPEWVLLPGYAAYVGGDIAAGWLSSGMADGGGTRLLIDIGTNGEMLLQHEGRTLGCATAAGPAFEGAQLSWGTRAIGGAVSRLEGGLGVGERMEVRQIGRKTARAVGFCGSAYIDFLAMGRRSGLLSERGRFDVARAAELGIALGEGDGGRCWYLRAEDREGPSISEADIAILLQAKAAIRAGVEILLGRAGLAHAAVDRVYVAGGFGLNIGLQAAIDCGLLGGFAVGQIEVVGNAALGGAYLTLVDPGLRQRLVTAVGAAEVLELNEDENFEDAYLDALSL